MIIARICTPDGEMLFHGSCEVTGSPVEDEYRVGGWFPVQQFSFGFDEKSDKKEEQKPASGGPAGKGSPASPGGNAATGKNAAAGSGDKAAHSEMQLTKEADRATLNLMVLAMEEKSQSKGEKPDKEYHADIHILGSLAFEDGGQKRNIFPSVIIHLEGVHVAKWNISGSGDSRPSETVTLRYDRVAMHYLWTGDGKVFLPLGPKGWNQTTSKQWPNADPKFPLDSEKVFGRFLPKPSSV